MGRKPLTRFGPNSYSVPPSAGYGFAIHIGGSAPTRSFVKKLMNGPLIGLQAPQEALQQNQA